MVPEGANVASSIFVRPDARRTSWRGAPATRDVPLGHARLRLAQHAGRRAGDDVGAIDFRAAGRRGRRRRAGPRLLAGYYGHARLAWRSANRRAQDRHSAPSLVVAPAAGGHRGAGARLLADALLATPGSAWRSTQSPGPDVGYIRRSSCAPAARRTWHAGPRLSLMHYWARLRLAQHANRRAQDGHSAPSVAVRPSGRPTSWRRAPATRVCATRPCPALLGAARRSPAPAPRSPLRRRRWSCAQTAGPTWSR
jgi:hypothetical protein